MNDAIILHKTEGLSGVQVSLDPKTDINFCCGSSNTTGESPEAQVELLLQSL